MPVRPGIALTVAAIGAVWLSAPARTLRALAQDAAASQPSQPLTQRPERSSAVARRPKPVPGCRCVNGQHADAIETLLDELGDEQYTRREEATRKLFTRGPAITPRLRARLAHETDPEIQHRLRYILENIVPPQQAALLVRATPEADLQPGTVITHVNSRRVRSQAELRQRLVSAPHGSLLRVRGPSGPQDVGPIEMRQLVELCDYVAPRGEVLAQAVRLYATGLAEEAYRILRDLPEPIPESELSKPLRARIAYTAGNRASAVELMAGQADSVRPAGANWNSPSYFDLRGPGKAPFHLEWVMATRAGRDFYASQDDPDRRVLRILLPAHRFADALRRTAGYWWRQFRGELGSAAGSDHVAGNQLAVAAWMLYGMDLRSECCRLIEPRSAILRQSPRGIRKWVRVETDAWLPFLAGDARAALDGFYQDALEILQRPPHPDDRSFLTRNPRVAARLAFFLYQFPDDERVEKGLLSVSHHTHPALTAYLDWMLYALSENNHTAVRRHLQATLPQLSDESVLPYARAVALLEYAQSQPDQEVLRTARRRLSNAPGSEVPDVWLPIVDALLDLAEDRPGECKALPCVRPTSKAGALPSPEFNPNEARRAGARQSLALPTLLPFRDRPETSALWHTVEFLSDPPASATNHTALRQPLLAVPMGSGQQHWLILSRDRRLMHFDAAASLLTALPKPTPTWFPNPLTWPWIGREEGSGRTWVYCRRRVIEVERDANGGAAGLRLRAALNLRAADIPAFDRYVGPRFSRLTDAIGAVTRRPGENSEFLRREIKAHGEYCADPDLPEVGMIEPLREDPRVVHVALRGGPHLLIDTSTGRSWTSLWIQDQLGLETPPEFFAQALREPAADGSPIVMLMSDQGLIRFELGPERLTRIALPGDDPYPPLTEESTPYERRDPRWVYCARLPEDGGQVFRVTLADGSAAEVDMVNEALPPHYYDIRLRAEIRAALNRSFKKAHLPDLEAFIADATETVARWTQEQQPEP